MSGAAPACLRRYLQTYWMDNTEEEALALWQLMISNGSDLPPRSLGCLDAVLADPPPDLVEVMQGDGWIYLVHPAGSPPVDPYTFDEHVEWLRAVTERFRTAWEDMQAPR